jgi:UDP-glucuronate decarboxylase
MIDGFILLMESAADVTGPVNLGNPVEFTMLELAEKVLAQTKSRSKIDFRPLPPDDPRQRQPDIGRASNLLGWKPRMSLDEGLSSTIEYFRAVIARG